MHYSLVMRGCSGPRTKYCTPYTVSGLLVNTLIGSNFDEFDRDELYNNQISMICNENRGCYVIFTMLKSNSAPLDFPIQFLCICFTRSGQFSNLSISCKRSYIFMQKVRISKSLFHSIFYSRSHRQNLSL